MSLKINVVFNLKKTMSMEYDPALYDLDPRTFLKKEVDFYKKLIIRFNPRSILELGVGTGRIFSKLLPMVENAIGIDISDSMLAVCNKNCIGNSNYKLIKSSFVDFNLKEKVDFIYLPFNTFQHLLLEEDQIKCLKTVIKHLNQGGHFILDLMNGDNLHFDMSDWKQDYSTTMPDGTTLERTQKTLGVDDVSSIIHKQFKYSQFNNKVLIRENVYGAYMKINQNQKIVELLNKSGFKIEELWTDYSFNNKADAKKRIYCLTINEI